MNAPAQQPQQLIIAEDGTNWTTTNCTTDERKACTFSINAINKDKDKNAVSIATSDGYYMMWDHSGNIEKSDVSVNTGWGSGKTNWDFLTFHRITSADNKFTLQTKDASGKYLSRINYAKNVNVIQAIKTKPDNACKFTTK